MGIAYEAEDMDLGRLVALKFLLEQVAGDSQALERFRRSGFRAEPSEHLYYPRNRQA
jgi:eukaryotic-like serine/threonine-protein kinase